MPPIRRYLRITRHSTLEVRIYADRPQDISTWLLRRGDPALPRIIAAIKPLVLPKLREERERAKSKRKADRKGVKDSVVGEDFEVSIFLTQGGSRHSLVTKRKEFAEKRKGSGEKGKLTGWLAGASEDEPVVVREEGSEDGDLDLAKVPEVPGEGSRKRKASAAEAIQLDEDEDEITDGEVSTTKRMRVGEEDDNTAGDDKKKLGFRTDYDGFAIYGRILCLVVKRRGVKTQAATSQQMLESWVSTQAAQDAGIEDERDNG